MKGKDKCKMLKEIRKQIAKENDIEFVTSECKHKGECKGTCPKCEAEVIYLERELEKKRKLGKKAAVVGIAAGMMASTVACTPNDVLQFFDFVKTVQGGGNEVDGDIAGGLIEYVPTPTEEPLSGDVEYIPTPTPYEELEGEVAYFPED